MDRRPLSILLAVLIAFQSCLAGFAVCSEGGCCHAEVEAEVAHGECAHHEDHEHSFLVHSGESHPCECTDVEIDSGEMLASKRVEWSKPILLPVEYVVPAPRVETRVLARVLSRLPRARGDTSQVQRLEIVCATRLLL